MVVFITDEQLQQIEDTPWVSPESLTINALKSFANEPRVWLSDVIKVMTEFPDNIVQRRRAATALFRAARAADRPVFFGSLDRRLDQLIPQHYFDIPRALDHKDNSISTDMALITDDQFTVEWKNRQRWLNVRVDRAWVTNWLKSQLGVTPQVIPPLRARVLEVAQRLWPDKKLPARVGDRNKRIREAWPAGETCPDNKTFQRAFKHWQK
jgi:hypothetical protein